MFLVEKWINVNFSFLRWAMNDWNVSKKEKEAIQRSKTQRDERHQTINLTIWLQIIIEHVKQFETNLDFQFTKDETGELVWILILF